MRFAITGARGRLAPLIANHLRARGHAVDLYSRTGGGGIHPIGAFPASAPDIVVHCAWSVVPLTAELEPEKVFGEDFPLLERIVEAGGNARILFLSTGAVYGDTGSRPADEETSPSPLGAYARGKLAAEELLVRLAPSRAVILRTTNLLGETPAPERPQGVLPRMIAAAKGRGDLVFWGDGTATKDYLHCEDFLAALDVIVRTEVTGVWNVGSGMSHSLLKILAGVERLAGHKVPVTNHPHFPWDVSRSFVSVEKLRGLGWEPRIGLAEAVRRCWEAFA